MTDVTGFGLAGHLLEICRGSGLAAQLDLHALPLIEPAARHARDGLKTGASARNIASYGAALELPDEVPEWLRIMITDPQTSGGLLLSCAADAVDAVLAEFAAGGFEDACVIGTLGEGPPRIIGRY